MMSLDVYFYLKQAAKLSLVVVTAIIILWPTRSVQGASLAESAFPIWSPLSDFEIATIAAVEVSARPDADTLLALYTLASAEDRQGVAYRRYNARINAWLSRLKPKIKRKNPKQQAAYIHQAMHDEFFLKRSSPMQGYSADQSQLSQVFASQQFNCLSSSLLFIVIAKKLGLNVNGVVIPSHAFVELSLPQNQKVDIETTSYNGFDSLHDEAFYQREESQWFTDRDLEPPSYSDYINRDIISPVQMGLLNMWSQHTSAKRMAYADRMRLAEIRGHLMPFDNAAQKNRLVFYHQEFERLQGNDEAARLVRFYQYIRPYIDGLNEDYFNDEELRHLLISVKSQMALTDIKTGQPLRGLQATRELLNNLRYANFDVHVLQHNLFFALDEYISTALQINDFEAARSAFRDIEAYCLENDLCAKSFLQVYARWAESYWQQKDWAQTIDVYKDYLLINTREDLALVIRKNMQNAFINWAQELLWEGEWQRASNQLQQCISELRQALLCRRDLQKIETKVEQGYY